jgi:hypothetical protein
MFHAITFFQKSCARAEAKRIQKNHTSKENFTGVVCDKISHTGTTQSALVPVKITDTNANDRRPCSVSEINSET